MLLKRLDAPVQDEQNKKVFDLLNTCIDKLEQNKNANSIETIGESWIIIFENVFPIFDTLVSMKARFQELLARRNK